MDPTTMSQLATGVISSLLAGTAFEAMKPAAQKLWGVIKGRFSSPGAQEALKKLEDSPANDRAQRRFQLELEDLAEQDTVLAEALREFVSVVQTHTTITQNLTAGDNSTNSQVAGSGNTITINK